MGLAWDGILWLMGHSKKKKKEISFKGERSCTCKKERRVMTRSGFDKMPEVTTETLLIFIFNVKL